MVRHASHRYQGAYNRSDARCCDPDYDRQNCGSHRGKAKREQHRVLAPPIGIHIVQQISSERSCQRRCGRSNDS